MNRLFSTTLLMALLVGAGTIFSSSGCRKKKDTLAKIHVYDADNNSVSGAKVILKGEGTNTGKVTMADHTSSSDAYGEAVFSFNDVYQLGQAGVAVLNIYASKGTDNGTGIIKIEAETTSEESVFI